jgi:enoyl-CoA hydratase/carnithine racemase
MSPADKITYIEKPSMPVAHIVLDGCQAENYLTSFSRKKAIDDIRRAEADSSVSAIILSGPLPHSFCGGGDLAETQCINSAADVDSWLDSIVDLYFTLLRCKKPVIAAMSGKVRGQGLQLALLCDIRIADYTARFSEPELSDGVGCAIGSTIISQVTSGSVMTELVYGCSEMGALTALENNLIHHVVKRDELLDTAVYWANRLSSHDPRVFEYTKKIVTKRTIEDLKMCLPIAREMHRQLMTIPAVANTH